MFVLEYSRQFKKDLKLMAKRGLDTTDIRTAISLLENNGQVPTASSMPI